MRYLLDTNTCIGWIRLSKPTIVARLTELSPSDVVLCSVVVGELVFGVERSSPAHRTQNQVRLDELRQQFGSLPFNDAAAEHYGVVRAHLAALGTPIGANDLLIAATALANGVTLVTHNTVEFSRVPGLAMEDWG